MGMQPRLKEMTVFVMYTSKILGKRRNCSLLANAGNPRRERREQERLNERGKGEVTRTDVSKW